MGGAHGQKEEWMADGQAEKGRRGGGGGGGIKDCGSSVAVVNIHIDGARNCRADDTQKTVKHTPRE